MSVGMLRVAYTAWEKGLPVPVGVGDCYRSAAKLATKRRGARLVHGHVERPIGETVRHHAWVEAGRKHRRIIDPTIGLDALDATLRKQGIRYVAEQSYDPTDALALMVRSGHWGPWHE